MISTTAVLGQMVILLATLASIGDQEVVHVRPSVQPALQVTPGQSDVFDQFFRYTETELKAFYGGMPDETIDPFSGTLHIVHTDVVRPVKAGLDLRIVRWYSSKVWGRTDDPSIGSLLGKGDHSVLGYGWSFHMGRIKNPNASGAPTGPCSADYPEGAL